MKQRRQSIVFIAAVVFLFANSFAQNRKLTFLPVSQDQAGKVSDEDKVYSIKEVQTKAVIKNQKELDPGRLGFSEDCQSGARVYLTAVLRKSGKVTDIKVKKPAMCSLDAKAAKIVRSIKFTPAIKGGVAVSQSIDIQFDIRRF